MEPEANQEALGNRFSVIWHRKASEDLKSLDPPLVEDIVRSAESKLQKAPHLIGKPLKGTTSRLWKLRFGKHRLLYMIHRREVVVLAVGNRDFIYNKRNASVRELIQTAAALHEQLKGENPKAG